MFLVVSYKADKTDTCRGCVVGRYSSDFRQQVFLSADEVIEHICNLDVNEREDWADGEWEHYIYTPESMKEHTYLCESYPSQCLDFYDDDSGAGRLLRAIDRRSAELTKIKEDKQREKKQAEAERRIQEQSERERAELKRLLAKHGTP